MTCRKNWFAVAHGAVGGREPRVVSSAFPDREWELEGSRGTALQQQRERSANMSLQRDDSLLSGPSFQIAVPSLGKHLCLSEKPACTRLFATTASCGGQRTTSVLPAPEDQFPDHLSGATKDKKSRVGTVRFEMDVDSLLTPLGS